MTTKRVAAIDCGTNSIRLLIADLNPRTEDYPERLVGSRGPQQRQQQPLADVTRQVRIVRLGQGMDRTAFTTHEYQRNPSSGSPTSCST